MSGPPVGGEPINDAVLRLRSWGEARDWKGYDPYDGLTSPAAAALSFGTPLGRRLLTQVVKLSPINVRPLLGIKPAWNQKAIGLIASAYVRLAAVGDDSAHAPADRWLAWLADCHRGGAEGMAWSYPFEVQTRVFRYPAGTPNTIATTFAADAFLDAWEYLGDRTRADAACAAAEFLMRKMLSSGQSGSYFRYLPGEAELVHNANLLACATVARTARLKGEDALPAEVRSAVETTLMAQRADGSWPYSDTPGHDWVDNFHTGYVLSALAEITALYPEAREPLLRGTEYWRREFFLGDGTPKYFPHRLFPIDAHCYATAIDTWVALRDLVPDALSCAAHEAQALVERMLDPSGYVHFQQRRLWTNKVPLVRWTTAPAFRALAGLELARPTPGLSPDGGSVHARLD